MKKKKMDERIIKKCENYQEQGFADKDYRFEYKGKRLVMNLSNNVFEQNKILSLAEIALSNNYDFEKSNILEEEYLKYVAKNTLVDGVELSNLLGQKDFELPQLHSFSVLYYAELLAPLSQWRDIVAKEILL